jgi:hypothetical protein
MVGVGVIVGVFVTVGVIEGGKVRDAVYVMVGVPVAVSRGVVEIVGDSVMVAEGVMV